MQNIIKFHFSKILKTPFFFSFFFLIEKKKYYHNIEQQLTDPKLKENSKNEELEDIVFKFFHNFLKGLIINGLFHNKQIINEGSSFVEMLSEQEILQNAVSILVINNIKQQIFRESGYNFSKNIVSDLIQEEDSLLEKDLHYLILRTLRDPELKNEVLSVFLWLMQQKEVKDNLIDLFSKAVQTNDIRKPFTNALKSAFFEILMNKSTVDKMKVFSFNVLELESNDEEGTVKKLLHLFQQRFMASNQNQNTPMDSEQEEIRQFFFFSP